MGNYIFQDRVDLKPTHSFCYLGFPGDVVLLGNASGVTDGSRLIATGTWSPSSNNKLRFSESGLALKLNGSARLTVGGDWSASAGDYYLNLDTSSIVTVEPMGEYRPVGDYNIFCRLVNSPHETKAVYADKDLKLVLTAQAGADVICNNQDANIKIGAEAVVSRNRETYSFGAAATYAPLSNQSSAIAIDVKQNLSVLSDLIGTIEAVADLTARGIRVEATSGTITPTNTSVDQKADAIGFRIGGDMVLERNFNATVNATATMNISGYASLAATGNTADAVGLKAAGNLTIDNGEWNGAISAVTAAGIVDARLAVLVEGSTATNASNVSGNSFRAYGILADGDISVSHLADGTISAESSDNTLTAEVANGSITMSNNTIGAVGIKGGTVNLGRVDDTFSIAANASGNILSAVETAGGTSSAFNFASNTVEAVGIDAETLLLGSFHGEITADLSGSTFTKTWTKSPSGDSSKFNAMGIRVSGDMTVSETLRGTISVTAADLHGGSAYSNSICSSVLEFRGIKTGGDLKVNGRIDTEIALTTGVVGVTSGSNVGIDVKNLTAEAYSGDILAFGYLSAIGLNVRHTLSSGRANDAFDFNGNLAGYQTGIAAFNTLNLRVSGMIVTADSAIVSERYLSGTTLYVLESVSGNNDRVELAAGAVVVGDIDLHLGTNTLVINSGASVTGTMLASNGNMNLRFDLDGAAQDDAVVSTSLDDISLTSNATISVNLNRAETGTYTLLHYSDDVTAYWASNKGITFSCQGESRTFHTGANAAPVEFTDENGNRISAELHLDGNDIKVTVTNTGFELPDFEFAGATFQALRINSTAAPTEVSLVWGDQYHSTEETAAAADSALFDNYEVEYRIDKKDGNGYGKSIVVTVAKDAFVKTAENTWKHGVTLNCVGANETIVWRVRGTTGNGDRISKWSDEGENPYTAAFSYGAAETGAPQMPTNSAPRAVNPDNADGGNNASYTSFRWAAATGDVEIARYTVRYVQSESELREVAWADADEVEAVTVDGKSITLARCQKTTTACEIFASNLRDQSFIYWQVKATDVEDRDSEWQDGESFRVMSGDNTVPVWTNSNKPQAVSLKDYTLSYNPVAGDDELTFDIEFSWKNDAFDTDSGVKSILFSYKLKSDSWDDSSKVTSVSVNDPRGQSVVVRGLAAGSYDYRIQAVDWVGNRSAAITNSMELNDTIAPVWGETGANVTPKLVFNHPTADSVECTVNLSWDPATDEIGFADLAPLDGAIKEYRLTWSGGGTATLSHGKNYAAPATSINFKPKSYGNCSYTVTAVDFAGNTATKSGSFYYGDNEKPTWSSDETPEIDVVYDPGDPEHLTYSATVSWGHATDNDRVRYYRVEYTALEKADSAASWETGGVFSVTVNPAAENAKNECTLENLQGFYACRIHGIDYFGNKTEYLNTSVLGDTVAPEWTSTVVNKSVAYHYGDAGAITVTADFAWEHAVDSDNGSGVKGYVFEYKAADQETWESVTTTECSYSIAALAPGRYDYRISAVDYMENVSTYLAGEIPLVSADITDPTNRDVTVTAAFNENSVTRQYSLNGEKWSDYPADGVTMTGNGTVYFRGFDDAGNLIDKVGDADTGVGGFIVANIDKVPPPMPVVTADITAPTRQNVTLTAVFGGDSAQKLYSRDGETWSDYPVGGVVATDNGTVYFRAVDALGNAATTSYKVSNIDRIAPAKPTVSADITAPTRQNVTVTAIFGADSAQKLYSTDQKQWSSYTGGIVMKENGTVYFRAVDAVGNVSDTATYSVTNIDRIPPAKPTVSARAVTTAELKAQITVTAAFSADSVQKQYSLDNKTWRTYTGGIEMKENGTVYFRGIDAAGNISEVAAHTVNSITCTVNGDESSSWKTVNLTLPGWYTLGGNFGDITGTVSLLSGGKQVGKGTLKDGVLSFNKGKSVLLNPSLVTELQVAVKGGTDTKYSAVLVAEELFDRGDTDSATNPRKLGVIKTPGASLVTDGWVGFCDERDYLRFSLDAPAKLMLDCSATDATKFTLYDSNWKKVTGAALKGANSSLTTKAAVLDAGTYYVEVQSTNAKRGGNSDYRIGVNSESLFFTKRDNSDDLHTSAKDLGKVKEAKTLDTGWVGYGDAVDFKAFTLESAAKMKFAVNATDATKLTVYQSVGGKLKSLGKTSVKSGTAETKELLMGAGTYYLEVQSTNAKKGGDSTYSLAIDKSATFFTRGDNSDDLYVTAKPLGVVTSETGTLTSGWVGFGDAVDFAAFTLETPATLQFNVNTDGATKLSVCTERNGKLKNLQTTSFGSSSGTTSALFLTAGNYFLSMQSTNAKKGGSADYSIVLNSNSQFHPADYTGPKTSDGSGSGSSSGYTAVAGFGSTSTGRTTSSANTSTESLDFASCAVDTALRSTDGTTGIAHGLLTAI